jgi:hypothetical protein
MHRSGIRTAHTVFGQVKGWTSNAIKGNDEIKSIGSLRGICGRSVTGSRVDRAGLGAFARLGNDTVAMGSTNGP